MPGVGAGTLVGQPAASAHESFKVNDRNTQEVLDPALRFARGLLTAEDADEDGVPLISPTSAGRHGPEPIVVKLPSLGDEAHYIVERLKSADKTGTPWQDIAVIYARYEPVGKKILSALRERQLHFALPSLGGVRQEI